MSPSKGYLHNPVPLALILGSFFFITLPLFVLPASWMDVSSALSPINILIVVFGLTHFFAPFVLYFQEDNLKYFWTGYWNKLTYFVVPLFIFAFFYVFSGCVYLSKSTPATVFGIFLFVRALDFYHVSSQPYGVLQLLKAPGYQRFPGWLRKIEWLCFMLIVVLKFNTYLSFMNVHVDPFWQHWMGPIYAAFAATLLLMVIGYGWASRRADARFVGVCAGYVFLQVLIAGFTIYDYRYRPYVMMVHWLEYHVMLYPRFFNVSLGQGSLDKTFVFFSRSKILFYALLVAASCFFFAKSNYSVSTVSFLAIDSLTGAISIAHTYIDGLLWRFKNPYFQKRLRALYFPEMQVSSSFRSSPWRTLDV